MDRNTRVTNHLGEVISTGKKDISWEVARVERNNCLTKTDLWYLKDRWDELSSTKKGQLNAYRKALRNLPQDYPGDNANEACDNWPEAEDWF